MTIQEMIDWLSEMPDRSLEVLMESNGNLMNVCYEDSGIAEVEEQDFLILNPCYGHDDEKIEVEVRGDDF